MSGLTTHVLDLAHGKPAANVKIELYMLQLQEWKRIKTMVTNNDGRLDLPLLSSKEIILGEYELVFYAGDYFRSKGIEQIEPPFLDKIPVRFGIASPMSHYHIPLLLSPWGYQVYRGS